MNTIRVLLADDHTLVRQGLKCLLKDADGIQVVGEAENGHQLLQLANKTKPDVIVADISMPILDGELATERLKKEIPHSKILILSIHTDENYVFRTFKLGASGYVVKSATAEEIVTAIKAVHRGDKYISPAVSERVVQEFLRGAREIPSDSLPQNLTFRELQILKLIAEGWASNKIAEHLHISTRTVETHRNNIMQKLKLHRVADLVKYAIRRGLVQVEP